MSSLSNVCEKYNVFKQAVVSLDWSEAYAILKNFKPDSTPYINSPIVKPKGGDVYIYFTTDELKEDDYIQCNSCNKYYHYDCSKLTYYYKSGKAKKWICHNFGFNCEL